MLETRVMPCLLIEGRRLVKTRQFKKPVYVGDPVNAIKIYNEKEVDELIVLDIAATRESRPPNFEVLSELTNECFMPLCYGGGVKSVDEAARLFGLGIEKVALNSAAHEDPDLITKLATRFGSQAVVISIDVKQSWFQRSFVFTRNGKVSSKKDPALFAKEVEARGAGEILLTSIDREGTWSGFDIPLIHSVSSAVSIPVIASGGAGDISHFAEAVHKGKASALALGSMAVFQGKDLGVLINFPKRNSIITALSAEKGWA